MGIETLWCRPRRTSIPDNGHRKYPYLLRNRVVDYADEVCCADITYIPMPHGHAYLCAVMGWHSCKVLGWAVSNTMDAALTEKALAISRRLPEHTSGWLIEDCRSMWTFSACRVWISETLESPEKNVGCDWGVFQGGRTGYATWSMFSFLNSPPHCAQATRSTGQTV